MANAKRTMLKFFKGFLEQDPVSCLLMLPDIPHVKIYLMSIFNTSRSSSISKTSVLIHFRQTFFPTSVVARRLKSRHPFVPAAQQLIGFSDNNTRAVQWTDHQRNAEWGDNPTRLRTLIPDTGAQTPIMTLPRRAWVRLNRLRSGVGRFRPCLCKWDMTSSAVC